MASQLLAFKAIDNALARYYQKLGYSNYRNDNGNGIFLQYIINEELLDEELPIDKELGPGCDPNDCAYSWMNNDTEFPVPDCVVINDEQKEAFIFYVLQYCYKYSNPPSLQYITEKLIPRVGGSISNTTTFNSHTISNGVPVDTKKDAEADEYINDDEAEGAPQNTRKTPDFTAKEVTRLTQNEFKPKYPARAHLNIFTAKELTKELRDVIDEEFENELILYYYSDISTALQMNDSQMIEYKMLIDGEERRLSVINYDLHIKGTNEMLYGIIIPNDNYKIHQDKWLWKLDEFLTADDILKKYKIKRNELPLSSRRMARFEKQLSQTLVIEECLIDDTDWFTVQQIKSLKRNIKIPKVVISLSREMWIFEIKKSFQNVDLPLIPVVVNKNNNHWIEWIKIISISSQNIYVGISCKYSEYNNKWSVESICLDRGDIYNKHRLVGLKRDKYNHQLSNFKTSITEIRFSDNERADIDKKISVLKQQIKSQQDSIVRLKESLLRAKNANKYNNYNNNTECNGVSEDVDIKQFIDERQEEDMNNICGDKWLDVIVNDVIKMYDVLEFRTNPIGAKRNIYIDKQFTSSWMNYVHPSFGSEAMMYYWLDYTTAMQMVQGYSKQYISVKNRKFMVAIINYELRDNSNNILYGIILCSDDKQNKNNDKYPYKLNTLMTASQILNEFGINKYDLPAESRKNIDFINKLLLKRKIIKQDLNRINWSNLKLFKSQSTNNDIPLNKSVTMTQKVMKEYCLIALERLNNNNNNNLIPIVVIDKHHNYYGIEWVLIVHIIHRNCDIGISFRFDNKINIFIATAIYLDKGEIESKHKLIGLKKNYCTHLRPFSLRKFKFKSDKHSICIDDDDDIAIHHNNNNQLVQMQQDIIGYKKALKQEQLKNHHLQQSLHQNNQMFMAQINSLKEQNQQYIMHQMSHNQQSMGGYPYDAQFNAVQYPRQYNNDNININNNNNGF